jgi:predicted nucleic acid-binding Zn ribbon protein
MAKRHDDFLSIDEILKEFIKENNLTKGIQKLSVEKLWPELMGSGVASYTESVTLKNKTLIIKLKSSVLREELSYGKEKIIKMINEHIGEDIINQIKLL